MIRGGYGQGTDLYQRELAMVDQERKARFCAWIEANSCACSRVKPTKLDDVRGWGGVAQVAIRRGETLLAFPPSMLLDVSAAKRSAEIGPELMRSSEATELPEDCRYLNHDLLSPFCILAVLGG